MSGEYSLYTDEDVIHERDEEQGDEEYSNDIIESLGRSAIRNSQVGRTFSRTDSLAMEEVVMPVLKARNSIMKRSSTAAVEVQRISR